MLAHRDGERGGREEKGMTGGGLRTCHFLKISAEKIWAVSDAMTVIWEECHNPSRILERLSEVGRGCPAGRNVRKAFEE